MIAADISFRSALAAPRASLRVASPARALRLRLRLRGRSGLFRARSLL